MKLSSDLTFLHKWLFPAVLLIMAFGSILQIRKDDLAPSLVGASVCLLLAFGFLYPVRNWAHCIYEDGKFGIRKNFSTRWISERHLVLVRPHRLGHSSNIELRFKEPSKPEEMFRIRPPGIFSLRDFDEVAAFLSALVERNAAEGRRVSRG